VIPYWIPSPIQIGDFRIDWWIALVVIGIAAGTEFSRARAVRENLSVKVTVDCTLYMVLNGFLFAHFLHVLGYNWDRFVADPIILAPWYGGYSSTGGFLGAAIAIPLFLKWKKAPVMAYVDNLCIGFVLGWMLGRTGCFTAHDHKGAQTDFFMAVAFPERLGGPRHDLGLYEALIALTIFVVLVVLDRRDTAKRRFHGFYSAITLFIYAPFRFSAEFLRARDLESFGGRSDIRWFDALTPAQVGAVLLFVLGIWIWRSGSRRGRLDTRREILRDFPPDKLPDSVREKVEAMLAETGESLESSAAT
jgi:phosphatidylglycerol:prolipoprotein diacylglycerol transferase